MLKIEKGIQVPARWERKYPFRDMEVGDSFAVPAEMRARVLTAASHFSNRSVSGAKFTTRKQDDGSIRVWRIA